MKLLAQLWGMKDRIKMDTVQVWLWTGLVLIIIQIVLGGITRLTGSGLSITRWDIITGIVYPFTEEDWMHHYNLYKESPQFKIINSDFTLKDFKFIFFWEYLHRLWARMMGFVFLIPFLYFLLKKSLSRELIFKLTVLVLLASFVATLGWIMVASGLESRPWVNAYKLAFHLSAALLTLAYLFKIILWRDPVFTRYPVSRTLVFSWWVFFILVALQLFLGGLMAGMKAAIVAPTWPSINGSFFPPEIFNLSNYAYYLFDEYELSHTGPIIVQFWHRLIAYCLFTLSIYISVVNIIVYGSRLLKQTVFLISLVFIQIGLGVLTLWNSIGKVSLVYGSLHQLMGIFLFLFVIYIILGSFGHRQKD